MKLSVAAADAGNINATSSIETDGLQVQVPIADTNTTGVLTDTDWDTFNDGVTPITDGSTPGAGEIGETSNSEQALTTTGIGATTVYGSATSITLAAGIWEISGQVLANDNAANLSGAIVAGIGTSSGGAGLTDFNTIQIPFASTTSSVTRAFTLLPLVVSIGASTTYYLNTKFTYDSGTPQHGGRLQARRVR